MRGRTFLTATVLIAVAGASGAAMIGSSAAAGADPASPAAPVDPAAAAWSWIEGQLGTGTPVVGGPASIAADAQYPASWTGAVSGSFVAPADAVASPAAVAVDSPAVVDGTYSGVVHGHVTLPPEVNRWIIQVYRDTASGRVQVPLQALAGPDGAFAIDLGAAGAQPAGSWAIGVLDAHAWYAPAGLAWPDPGTYPGWTVRALVTTDVTYDIGSAPALGNGRFAFPDSRPGTKTFQLVDPDGAVRAEQAPDTGLVRSFASPDGSDERAYAYDQAMALITAVGLGQTAAAEALTRGLLSLQVSAGPAAGAFAEVAAARNPAEARPVYRTGISSFATYALLSRMQTMASTDPSYASVRDGAVAGVTHLLSLQRPDGLLSGGSGTVMGDGSVDPAPIGWASTEHALDAWHTLRLAGAVLAGTAGTPAAPTAAAATAAAASLQSAILSELWTGDRFRQGISPSGAPDDADALDANSWGAVFLTAIGRADLATLALAHVAQFAATDGGLSGYRPFYPQPSMPNAPAVVWLEGTAGVALAQHRLGQTAAHAATVATLASAQLPDGSLPYATSDHPAAGMTTAGSVCAAAWYIVAATDPSAPILWAP